jgi:hypothetical protein
MVNRSMPSAARLSLLSAMDRTGLAVAMPATLRDIHDGSPVPSIEVATLMD